MSNLPFSIITLLFVILKLGKSTASCISKPQSSIATIVLTTYIIIDFPPGEPITNLILFLSSKTIVGDIELNGLFLGSTILFINKLFFFLKLKSLNWLFNKKPFVINLDPNLFSMLEVIEATLP